jgi:hypothetical protein
LLLLRERGPDLPPHIREAIVTLATCCMQSDTQAKSL